MVNARTDEIAVIRTRLPYIDRRALSQAWFSALRCACESDVKEDRRRSPAPVDLVSAHLLGLTLKASSQRAYAVSAPRVPSMRPRAGSGVMDATNPARIGRTFVASDISEESSREKISHMRFMMTVAGARIALHVRRDGAKVIVIAVCSSRHVDLVRRALTEAATGMRFQGEHVDTAVRAVDGEDRG